MQTSSSRVSYRREMTNSLRTEANSQLGVILLVCSTGAHFPPLTTKGMQTALWLWGSVMVAEKVGYEA